MRLSDLPRTWLLVVLATLCGHPPESMATERIAEHLVTLHAESLPTFRADPHVPPSQKNPISGVVRVVLQDARGWMWFGTQNGLARHDGDSLVYFDLRDIHGQSVTVRAIAEDSHGNVWIGSTGGITEYDGAFFTSYTSDDGLISDDVWCLNVDDQDTLWVGTTAGACRLRGDRFHDFELPLGIRSPERGVSTPAMIRSISNARSGGVWIVGEGVVFRYDGRDLSVVDFDIGESPFHVSHLLEDTRGRIWLATQDEGVWLIDGDDARSVTSGLGTDPLEAAHVFEDSRGDIWFPIEGLGLCRSDDETVRVFESHDGIELDAKFMSAEDDQGRLWFGGFGGVVRYDGSTFVNVTRDGPW